MRDFVAMVAKAEAAGNEHMILTAPRKRPPPIGRCNLLPGLPGRCVGWDGALAIIDVRTADARAWLIRRGVGATPPATGEARDG
jgi:hypothetical protein